MSGQGLCRVEEEAIDGLNDVQGSDTSAPPEQLPFDLTAELGTVIEAEEISSGVYHVSAEGQESGSEYYVVTEDAPAISDQARSYGRQFAGKDGLRIYDQHCPGSGRRIIEFEVMRYQIKHHLPVVNHDDSVYTAAIYGMEEHPDYFGEYPVPGITPRGYTVRYKKIINGVYWLETDRCEEMLSVCYPIWQADLTIPEQNLGEQLEYDRVHGIDTTLGSLFFPGQSSCIPLFELSVVQPEIETTGIINMDALFNAISSHYPEYTAAYNEEQAKFERGRLIRETPGVGTVFIKF